MSDTGHLEEIVKLLREIRAAQAEVAENQARQLALAEEQLKETRERLARSMALQETAVSRQRQALVLGLPLVLFCIGMILYLVWRFL